MKQSTGRVKKRLDKRFQEAGEYWLDKQPADLGNHAGVVRVPNTMSMVYCRVANGQVVEAFNNVAPNIADTKVFIGRDKSQPSLLRVIEVRWAYNYSSMVAYVPFHHTQHEYPAPDTVWVRRDQFMPLLVLPMGEFSVRLFGDVIYTAGMSNPLRIANEDFDLSAYESSGGAFYLLMEAQPDGDINFIQGDSYSSLSLLRSDGVIPAPTAGSFPIAAIEIYEGQTEIRRDDVQRNIIDLRMFTSDAYMTTGDQISAAEQINIIKDGDLLGFYKRDDSTFHSISFQNFKWHIKQYTEQIYALMMSSGAVGVLDDLTDVTIVAPADGEVLTYSGGLWTNAAPTGGSVTPWVYEDLSSQIPAINDEYLLSNTPSGEVMLFWNSTFQTQFNINVDVLELDFSPDAGDTLIAIYDVSGTFVEPSASPALRIYMNQNFTM